MSLSLLNKAYRRCVMAINETKSRLLRCHYKLMGQVNLHPQASIHPGAVLAIAGNAKRGTVVEIGEGSVVKSAAYLGSRKGFIKIGRNCSINRNCVLLGYGGITIGDNVRIACNTAIVAFNHNYEDGDQPIANQGNRWEGITIQDDVWIGSGVRILDGVVISKGAVVGAGSVVTRSVDPYSVVAGVPAKEIKQRRSRSKMP